MDTGPELHPQSASVHADADADADLQPAKKHTDPEFGTQPPPQMHNDPKPQLLAVPVHSDPEPTQATVQEEELDTSATKPGGSALQCVGAVASCDSLGIPLLTE